MIFMISIQKHQIINVMDVKLLNLNKNLFKSLKVNKKKRKEF